jgi:hypothetical protein
LFKYEMQWKNLICPPLMPANINHVYSSKLESNLRKTVSKIYDRSVEGLNDFITQLIGLFLAENF